MTAKLKSLRWLACAGLLVLGAGCGGIHASKSVSPMDFLVPGSGSLWRSLLYVPPAAPVAPTNTTAAIVPVASMPTHVASVQ